MHIASLALCRRANPKTYSAGIETIPIPIHSVLVHTYTHAIISSSPHAYISVKTLAAFVHNVFVCLKLLIWTFIPFILHYRVCQYFAARTHTHVVHANNHPPSATHFFSHVKNKAGVSVSHVDDMFDGKYRLIKMKTSIWCQITPVNVRFDKNVYTYDIKI